jgi:hypothetical protein
VLVSQGGSLLYYITFVNRMYAYHRTLQGPALIPAGPGIAFPLTASQGGVVQAFATAHGDTIIDPEALAIEVRSSWAEASAVPNPADYIQTNAEPGDSLGNCPRKPGDSLGNCPRLPSGRPPPRSSFAGLPG